MSLARGGWAVWLSLLLACLLSIVMLPTSVTWLRPDWVLLVVIYWVLALDNRAAVGLAWVMGVVLDLLHNTLLGEHALALVIAVYFVLKLRKRMRVYPLPQQMLVIFFISLLYQLIKVTIQLIIASPPLLSAYWFAALVNALLWPLVLIGLRYCRRRFKVAV